MAMIALALPAVALTLTGCFNGPNATTNYQATKNSGQGVSGQVGPIKINNATLVLGPDGSKSATLIMSVTNQGQEADELKEVRVNGTPAVLTDGSAQVAPVEVKAQGTLGFGYETAANWANSYDFEAPVSTWVPVTVAFAKAGTVELKVLTVGASGIYTGIAPAPAGTPLVS